MLNIGVGGGGEGVVGGGLAKFWSGKKMLASSIHTDYYNCTDIKSMLNT